MSLCGYLWIIIALILLIFGSGQAKLTRIAQCRDLPNRYDTRQKFNHFYSMISLTVEEIESVPDFLYRDRILLRAMLQDQLLQKQKSPLMRYFCRTCTRAFQVFLAASLAQSGHWPCWTRYSISNICSSIVEVRTLRQVQQGVGNKSSQHTSF